MTNQQRVERSPQALQDGAQCGLKRPFGLRQATPRPPQRTPSRGRKATVWVAAHALVFALGAATLPTAAQAGSQNLWSERAAGSAPLAQVPDFRKLAHQLIPAVVSIAVEQRVKSGPVPQMPGMEQGPGGPQDPLEFFHRYFGNDMPREYKNHGLGSGFVIDASGLILTNYHVVEDADSIEVTLDRADGSEQKVKAKVLGSAPNYDVALLKTEETLDAAIAYLGNSEATDIGDWVMAVGNPFGLSHSVSVGIISAKERRDISPSGRHGLYNFLQTDASINPGNSGGPLINMHGEVIGINSAINASGAGIGFAIPINMVKEMLPELKSRGRYTRSWLGVSIQGLTADLAQSFGLTRTNGALIAAVIPDGPAAKAGLRAGDVVLQFDNKELRAANDLPLFASMAGTERKIPLRIFRDGKELTVGVQLGKHPDEPDVAAPAQTRDGAELGMRIADLSPRAQRELGLEGGKEGGKGVVVRSVDPMGAAAKAGLLPGDLLLSVNGRAAQNARAFAALVRNIKPGEPLRFEVSRQGGTLFLAMRKP